MEVAEIDPRSVNQFFSIGAILIDMRFKPDMNFDDEFIDFIYHDYYRIEFELTNIWKQKPRGLDYILDSHAQEADRLLEMVVTEELRKDERKHESDERACCRAAIYSSMIDTLTFSIVLIQNLLHGDYIDLEGLY